MNVWLATGRVGRDAELRTTNTGKKVLGFTLANETGFGERKKTQWADCQIWGPRAEALANFIKKGDKLTVSGELTLEEFTRRDGTPGSKLSLDVKEVELDGSRKQSGDSDTQQASSRGNYSNGNGKANSDWQAPDRNSGGNRGGGKPAFDQDMNDEIPF